VLRGIFGPKRDEVIGGWRKLYNEELHNLYCSPYIIRIKSTHKVSITCSIQFGRKLRHKLDLKETVWGGRVCTGFMWPRIGSSEHGNEPSRSIECWQFFD
jgi:hypothetical protein